MRESGSNKKIKLLCILFLVAFLSGAAGAALKFRQIVLKPAPATIKETVSESGMDKKTAEEIKLTGKINVLLVGEDNVEQSRRSDTIVVIAIDLDGKNMRVLSVPRDTRAAIPRHGQQKVNHAFAYGGVELLDSTLEGLLGCNIHYYVNVDYDSFPQFVDLIGGVDIYVQRKMKYIDRAAKLNIDIMPGQHRMNGDLALKFVRFRHDALGDIGRIRRQQQFLKACLARIHDPSNLVRINDIFKEAVTIFKTDMTPMLAMQLVAFMQNLEKERIFFSTLPGTPATIDGLSYWVADVSAANRFLNDPVETLIEAELKAQMSPPSETSMTAVITTAADDPSLSPEEKAALIAQKFGSVDQTSGTAQANPRTATLGNEEVTRLVLEMSEPIAVLNGSGVGGIAKRTAEQLQRLGIDVTYTGNAKHNDYQFSNVIYPEGASQGTVNTAKMLGKLCGVPDSLVRANKLANFPSIIVGKDGDRFNKRLEGLNYQ